MIFPSYFFEYISVSLFSKFCCVGWGSFRAPKVEPLCLAKFSRSIDELLNETKNLVNNGAKEITLLGQNVNAYNFGRKKLSDLINKISEIDKLERIRYTTSHPVDFTKDLIKLHNCMIKLIVYIFF